MSNTALVFGAGKTGRGFAAHLAFRGGYDIVLIDKNRSLVEDLRRAGHYRIEVLGQPEQSRTVPVAAAYAVAEDGWHEALVHTSLVFTAVFGNHLDDLARDLAAALQKRHRDNPAAPLAVITCENLTGAARVLRERVEAYLGPQRAGWLAEAVGFSEGIVFSTCLDAAPGQAPLMIRAQPFFELPCDGDALKTPLRVYGLKPLRHFAHQLRRKIYTYNCINAVITYLGARQGYTQLHEAAIDVRILAVARQAAGETARALVAEYGFDPQEQAEWTEAAFAKFADRNIPDPIERNGADPARKLGREDRLVGPALLCLRHGISPDGLVTGILAAFAYRDPGTGFSVAEVIREKGPDFVLADVCGLAPEEPLFGLLKEKLLNQDSTR